MAIKTDAYYASCTYDSPVGMLTLAASEEGLKGALAERSEVFRRYPGQADDRRRERSSRSGVPLAGRLFRRRVSCYRRAFPGAERGGFQQAVWKLLCEIPSGEVRTYGDLAKDVATHLGKESMSAQAVGGAVGRNPMSIIVPCHRVVGAHGSLTGYAGGINRPNCGCSSTRASIAAASTFPLTAPRPEARQGNDSEFLLWP